MPVHSVLFLQNNYRLDIRAGHSLFKSGACVHKSGDAHLWIAVTITLSTVRYFNISCVLGTVSYSFIFIYADPPNYLISPST